MEKGIYCPAVSLYDYAVEIFFFRLQLLQNASKDEVPPESCFLHYLSVDAKFRRKGIGKMLLNTAETDAIEKGCPVN